MDDIIDILQQVADIEHWTRAPAASAAGEDLALPPIVVWRYKQRSTEFTEFFRQAVGTFRGTMAWEFSAKDRNWSLMPSRIYEYAKAQRCSGTLTAAQELKAKDPDFGKRANAELCLLAEHIQRRLLQRSTS
jgi:hypothetical protein